MAPLFPKKQPSNPLTTSEFARLTGVSLRQLQWWDEQGFLSPYGKGPNPNNRNSGSIRLYDSSQVRFGKLLGRVHSSGVQIGRVARSVKRIKLDSRLERYVAWSRPDSTRATVRVFSSADPKVMIDFLVRAQGVWGVVDLGAER